MSALQKKGWIAVAKVEDVVSGKPKVVEVSNLRIALVKVDTDSSSNHGIYAIQDICTHDDGPLAEGAVQGEEIECPRHGARFNIKTGEVLSMPAITPVQIFPVRIHGSQVEIEV